MKKTHKITALCLLLGSSSMLSAQFTSLPPAYGGGATDPYYQTMLTDTGYNPFTMDGSSTAGWDLPPSLTSGVDFDPSGYMRVFFVGQDAAWANSTLGIRLGGATSQYDPNASLPGLDFSIFDASVGYGFTVTIPLDGHTSFDFWLSTQNPDTQGQYGTDRLGIWSMFTPQHNNPNVPQTVQGKGTEIVYNGEIFHLYAWEDVYRDHETSDDDFNDFVFAVQFFHGDDTPFSPVPEPSTYGVIGVLGLLGVISLRRFKTKRG